MTRDAPALDAFLDLAKRRRSVRNFLPDPIPEETLERLLEAARWAPSGYNLQPIHFTVVDDSALKKSLRAACMDQRQVEEAPVVVILSGDRRVLENNLDEMIRMEREAGAITPEYEKRLRKFAPLAFRQGPLGINWLGKAIVAPLMRPFFPVPSIPAVHKGFWLGKSAGLCAMNLMLAAEAVGLASVPMEGFDPVRVRRAVGMPRAQLPCIVIAVGRAMETPKSKTRFPLSRIVHRNRWG